MGSNIVIDDTDTQYIAYAAPSDWTVFTGSTRQWESTVHSTNTYGATASFQFLGNWFIMEGTVPAGTGTVYVDITIDGGAPTRVTRTSGSDNAYANVFYQSPLLNSGSMHTVVFTNRGHATDSSFQFDRVQLLSLDGEPIITSPPNLSNGAPTTQGTANGAQTIASTTSAPGSHQQITSSTGLASLNMSLLGSTHSDTSLGQTVTLTQQLTKTGQPGSTSPGSTSTMVINTAGTQVNSRQVPLSRGAIAGIAVGGLFVLALLIAGCFVLSRRRKHSRNHHLGDNELETRQTHRSMYIPTPYGAAPHPATESTNRLLEKGGVHPTAVTRPQAEAEPRTARPSTNVHATDGDTGDGQPRPPSLNARPEESHGSRRQSAFEAPPAYQPNRGSAAGARTSIPPAFAGSPGTA